MDLKHLTVTFFTRRKQDGTWEKQKLTVSVPKGSSAGKLREAVAEKAGADVRGIAMGLSMRHQIYDFFDDNQSLDVVKAGSTNILCYEVELPDAFTIEENKYAYRAQRTQPEELPKAAVILYFGKVTTTAYSSGLNYGRSYRSNVIFADPLCFCHAKQTNPKEIYDNIAELLGVPRRTDLFKLYVCNAHGEPDNFSRTQETHVDRNDTKPVSRGLKQRLYLLVRHVP